MQQIREKMDLIDLDEDTIDAEALCYVGRLLDQTSTETRQKMMDSTKELQGASRRTYESHHV